MVKTIARLVLFWLFTATRLHNTIDNFIYYKQKCVCENVINKTKYYKNVLLVPLHLFMSHYCATDTNRMLVHINCHSDDSISFACFDYKYLRTLEFALCFSPLKLNCQEEANQVHFSEFLLKGEFFEKE